MDQYGIEQVQDPWPLFPLLSPVAERWLCGCLSGLGKLFQAEGGLKLRKHVPTTRRRLRFYGISWQIIWDEILECFWMNMIFGSFTAYVHLNDLFFEMRFKMSWVLRTPNRFVSGDQLETIAEALEEKEVKTPHLFWVRWGWLKQVNDICWSYVKTMFHVNAWTYIILSMYIYIYILYMI